MFRKFVLFTALLAIFAMVTTVDAGPEKKAIKDMIEALNNNDLDSLGESVSLLIQLGSEDSAKGMVQACKWLAQQNKTSGKDYWVVVRGTASFEKDDALKIVFRFIEREKRGNVARDILYLMKNGDATNLTPHLIELLGGGAEDIAVMAMDLLGSHGNKEAIEPLIKMLKRSRGKGVIADAAVRALRNLTGQAIGKDDEQWEQWWSGAQNGWQAKPPQENIGGGEGGGSGTVVANMEKESQREYGDLTKVPADKVIVLVADHTDKPNDQWDHNFDHIENTLDKIGVPHTIVKKSEFDTSKYKLDGKMALLINCNMFRDHCLCPKCKPGGDKNLRLFKCTDCNVHDPQNNKLSDAAVKKIKAFVEGGGYLFSEDWILEEVLERAWPKMVGVGTYMEEDHVTVLPASGGTAHPYMKRIFGRVPDDAGGEEGQSVVGGFRELGHQWKIDDESPSIKVKDKQGIQVLLTSPEIGKKYGGDDTVALTFVTGRGGPQVVRTGSAYDPLGMDGGRVVHVLSHFGKQKSEHEEYTLLNLLLNFMTEANQRRLAKEGK